jgi:hypothetical protein
MLQTVSPLILKLSLFLMTAVATHLVMSFGQTLLHYIIKSRTIQLAASCFAPHQVPSHPLCRLNALLDSWVAQLNQPIDAAPDGSLSGRAWCAARPSIVTIAPPQHDGAPAIVGRRLHQGFARSRSIRHRDWRENQSNTRPKLGPGWQNLGQRWRYPFASGMPQ